MSVVHLYAFNIRSNGADAVVREEMDEADNPGPPRWRARGCSSEEGSYMNRVSI